MLAKDRAWLYEMTDEDSNFVYHKVPKDVAVEMFEQDGQHDKVKLLKYRPLNYVRYYENGEEVDYFYGKMVPSTGYIKDFKLFYYSSGFVIKCPTPFMKKTSYFEEEPKLFDVFKKAEEWAVIGLFLVVLGLQGIEYLYDSPDGLVRLDWLMMFMAIGIAIVTSMIAGLYPAWRVCKIPPATQLKTQ